MPFRRFRSVLATSSVAAHSSAANVEDEATRLSADASIPTNQKDDCMQHSYVGMWVTTDGRIRHELLPNGRYDEA